MGDSSSNSASIPLMDKHAIFIGTFVHSQGLGELEYLLDTSVAVSAPEGVISAIEKGVKGTTTEVADAVRARLGWAEKDVDITDKRRIGQEGWFFPGFIGEVLFCFFVFFFFLKRCFPASRSQGKKTR